MSYFTSVCKLEMWLICKGAHCFEISIHKILFFFSIESAEQYIQAQAHTGLMTKAGRWPALAEPTPPRRRHVPRLTHGVARNHRVMNPSVFGRSEAHMSHDRERKRERGLQETKTEDKQSQVGHTLVPHSQSW